jgi:hypothetical protein
MSLCENGRRVDAFAVMRRVGPIANLFDTTDGCVGVATDAELDRFAGWTRRERPREIILR